MAQTTSKKHRYFVGEPMVKKLVTALPGIGSVLGGRLIYQGYDKVYLVLAEFLRVTMDKEKFLVWLRQFGVNPYQGEQCYNCLMEWCVQHL